MAQGFSDVLVGLQYGDEGKARVIDGIAEEYGVIARFNGGSNAGHTIEAGDIRISLHQVPSGVFYPDKILYIGSGCVVNPVKLLAEMNEVNNAGISLAGRFHISGLSTLVQPHHILIDQVTGGHIGTTGQGIGPAYVDRAMRVQGARLLNIRAGDLLSGSGSAFKAIRLNLEATIKELGAGDIDVGSIMDEYSNAATAIVGHIQRDTLFVSKLVKNGLNVLFEGAQSFMLDVVKGSVPYVTSSSTVAAAAYVGGDLPVNFHRKSIGVAKAIMSRVGSGPFISEFGGGRSEEYCAQTRSARDIESQYDLSKLLASSDPFEMGLALRVLGNEYGATTGRPRRVGSLDLVQLAYAVKASGVDELYLNKADLLSDFSKTTKGHIPIVTEYTYQGTKIDYIPPSAEAYRNTQPTTEYVPSFDEDISDARSLAELPKGLERLISIIGENICPVRGIGVGPRRDQVVLIK